MSSVKRHRAGVIGATGTVGQRFVELLLDHPWFELTKVGASPKSAGKRLGDSWRQAKPLPSAVAELTLSDSADVEGFRADCDIVFSAVSAEVGRVLEPQLASAGLKVFTNSSAMRMHDKVPVVVAAVNPQHMELVRSQPWAPGFIVCNSNCSVSGLATVLAPLRGVLPAGTRVTVATMQAVSGAGYPGVPSLDIVDNVIPYIEGEETKMREEARKILGAVDRPLSSLPVTAMCHRVPVLEGHTLAICLNLPDGFSEGAALVESVERALQMFEFPADVRRLPSAPERPIVVLSQVDRPQPRLERRHELTVAVGRVRLVGPTEICLVAVVNNVGLGAAGGSLLTAELAVLCGL